MTLYHYLSPLTWDADGFWRAPYGCELGLDFRALPDQALRGRYGDFPWAYLVSEAPVGSKDLIPIGEGSVAEIKPTRKERDAWRKCFKADAVGTTLLDWIWSAATSQSDPTGAAGVKPLIPTRDRVTELRLPFEGLVRSEPFAWQPTDTHPNRVRDVLRRDLADCDVEHAGRVLAAMAEKYRCDVSELSSVVVPQVPHTTITDPFSSALTGWTTVSGTWATRDAGGGNYRLYKSASDYAFQFVRNDSLLSSADHYAQVATYGTSNTFAVCGPAARCHSSAATAYLGYQSTGYAKHYKIISGSLTFLGQSAGTSPWAAGDLMKEDCNGSTITATFDGAVSHVTTDSSISGNVQCGVDAYYTYATGTTEVDDFLATDGLASGGLFKRIVGGGIF